MHLFSFLTLLSLYIHLLSLAATQTVYGQPFSMLRWSSLAAMGIFGFLNFTMGRLHKTVPIGLVGKVALYISLWGLTVLDSDFPLFSSYRWVAHALIVAGGLVLAPAALGPRHAVWLLNGVRALVALVLVISYFAPADRTVFDDPNLYRGVLGNPNALGHLAAVGVLLFAHATLTTSVKFLRAFYIFVMIISGVLVVISGARSSMLALGAGLGSLLLFYNLRLSKWSLVGLTALSGAFLAFPDLPQTIMSIVLKREMEGYDSSALDKITSSRQEVWQRHLNAFQERPLLGWGFGLDKDADMTNWTGELSALGVTGRDPTNDLLYCLEMGGVVGVFAYVFILSVIRDAWPSRRERSVESASSKNGLFTLELAHCQKCFLCIAVLLIVLFEFDNTALAAGNFFAALLWTSLGAACSLRRELRYRRSWASYSSTYINSRLPIGSRRVS